MNEKKIAVIGLGYVGLPLATEFGKHRPVVGFDIKQERIDELNTGKDSTLEVTPEGLKAAKHLCYSSNPEDLADCQIYIVTVPTPVDHVIRHSIGWTQGVCVCRQHGRGTRHGYPTAIG